VGQPTEQVRGDRAQAVTPFVGRDRELAEISAGLADARSGRGRLFLVGGEPGIGKTRLAEAVADQAEAEGMLALWGRCWDSGGAPAFWPWVQLLRGLVRSRDEDQLRGELGTGADWVGQLVPEMRERLTGVEAPRSLGSRQARFALFDAIMSFLRGASANDPLLIVLEDLHAADQASIPLLEFVARGLVDARIVALVTYQEAGARARPELEGLLGLLGRESRPLVLRGFGEEDLARLVEGRTQAPAPPELVSALRETTEGNPFFANEVVRLLTAEGQLELWVGRTARARFPLPHTVRETILRRFEPLGREGIEALSAAAVIGREFRLQTLERTTGSEPQRLIALIDEALGSGLVTEVPGAIGRFRFTHGLIRETLYASLGTGERIRLHRAAGEALERAYGDIPEHLPELAHHFAEAAQGGEGEKALEYAKLAGGYAMQVLAYEQAGELFELALHISDLLEAAPGRRAELMLALGEARTRADDPQARETLIAAAEAARNVGRPDLLAEAALGIRAFFFGTGRIDDALIDLLREALEGLDEGATPLRARVLARYAVSLYYCEDSLAEREELSQQAIDMARGLGDPGTLMHVIANAQLATWRPETTERDLAWAEELLVLNDTVGSLDIELAMRNRQIDFMIELDDIRGADRALRELERVAGKSPDPRAKAYLPLQRARRALIEGRFDEAETFNAEAASVGERLHDAIMMQLALTQRFGLRWWQGMAGEMEETVRSAGRLDVTPAWPAGVALVCCELGREAEARSAFERLAANDFEDLPSYNGSLIALALLTEVCVHLGDTDRARKLYDLMLPFADRNVISPHTIYAGPIARYLGMLAAARGEWTAAGAHFSAAGESAVRQGSRPVIAMLRLDRARMLAGRDGPDDRERALSLAAEAAEMSEELGMAWVSAHVEELRQALGADMDAGVEEAQPAAESSPGSGLLRREGDVWAFDYGGRTSHLRDSKGVRYLAVLLGNPGAEIHAADLAGAGAGTGAGTAPGVQGLEPHTVAGDAGPVLDAEAKDAYRRRLEELRDELEEAESFNDPERAAQAREEIEFLSDELAGAVGLGGRDRKAASSAERARVSVTKAIRTTLKRVSDHDPALGRELEATVRTGTFCVYDPDPRRPVAWRIEAG
jgi:tetratricopeptide (TPR) repeat protein